MRYQTHTTFKFMAAFFIALAMGIGIAHAQGLMLATNQTLPMNKIVQAAARINQSAYTYFFQTDGSGSTYLLIDSSTLQDGPSFVVQDITTNETVGIFRTSVTGACLQLDNAPGRYQLTVVPGTATTQQDYHLMLWQEPETQLDCPISKLTGKQNVVADGASPWEATTKGLQSVNLRIAPSVNSSIVAVLDPNISASIVGMTEDGKWLALKVNDTMAWVSADVVQSPNGGWRGLPIMQVPNYVPSLMNNPTDSGSSVVNAQTNGSTSVDTSSNAAAQINGSSNNGASNNNGSNSGGNNNGGGSTSPNPTAVPATPVPPPVVVPTSVPPPVIVPTSVSAPVDLSVSVGDTSVGVTVNAPVVNTTVNTVTCVVGGLLGSTCP